MGKPRRILLMEDEYLIAHDIADDLRGIGVDVVGPIPTVPKALEAIEADDPLDAAVLDVNLQGEMVFPVADRLLARNVPILFTTGYDESMIPPRFAGVQRCEKPVTSSRLKKALEAMLDRAV